MQLRYRIVILCLFVSIGMSACEIGNKSQELQEREKLRDAVRITDSLAAQPEIDSLIHLTDSIQRLMQDTSIRMQDAGSH